MSNAFASRPIGVVLVSLLAGLAGALLFLLGLYSIIGFSTNFPTGWRSIGVAGILIILMPGILELAFAYGAWKQRRWAWWLGVIGHGLWLAVFAYFTLASLSSPFSMSALPVIAIADIYLLTILGCLLTPQVRHAFGLVR